MSTTSPSFEDDMRRIREKRGISREALHRETKIALENIKLFEEGDLDRHPHFHEVYLRALVRAYAEVLDVSKEMALQALERSRSGAYRGELGYKYLDRDELSPDEAQTSDDDSGDEEESDDEDPEQPPPSVPAADEAEKEEPSPEQFAAAPEAGAAGERGGSADRRRSRRTRSGRGAAGGWFLAAGTGKMAMGAAGLVLIALAVWAFASLTSTSSPPEATNGAGEAADTAGMQAADQPAPREPVAVIGDSLDFTVVAESNRLEPIRVRIDGGPWNPYWVEQGDSISFAAQDAFALRSYLPRARLHIESLEWPLGATDRYDSAVVSREIVQDRIDSLSALPAAR